MGGIGPRGVSPGRPLLTAAEEAALVAPPSPLVRASKATPMHIRFKFGQLGGGKGQFNSPHGFCLGNDEDIIVADTNNHRITVNRFTVVLYCYCRYCTVIVGYVYFGIHHKM